MLSGEEAGRMIGGCLTAVIVAVIVAVLGATAFGVWVGRYTATQEQQHQR